MVDLLLQVFQAILGLLDGLAAADEGSITNMQCWAELTPVARLQDIYQGLMLSVKLGVSWGE